MSPKLGPFQKYWRRIRTLAEDTASYWRYNLAGNQIQRLTDFRSCERPVLLIYGYAATRRIFTILEKRLRKDGFCVFSVRLGGLFDTFNIGGIVDSAKLIQRKIDKLSSLYRLGPITIIGHSKGGLIGEYYVKNLGGSEKVCNLITLATPHRGSPWAALGVLSPLALVSASIRQMWPLSPFLKQLNETPMPEHVHFVSLYSRNDAVCPYPFCKLDTLKHPRFKNIEISDVSHSQFVISRRAYEIIRREVEMGLREAKHTPAPKPASVDKSQTTEASNSDSQPAVVP